MPDDGHIKPAGDANSFAAAIRAVKAGAARPRNLAPFSGDEVGLRQIEALLFAAAEPLDLATLKARVKGDFDIRALLARLQADYAPRGIHLVEVGEGWRFQTAPDMAEILEIVREEPKKLSQAASETLAIIAYHQPITRAEIEEIRGVAVSKGTLDILFEMGWLRYRGRKRTPGKPVTYGTTDRFLEYFGLTSLSDLPGVHDLRAAGLLSARIPAGFSMPDPGAPLLSGDNLDHDIDQPDFHVDFLAEDEPN
ncbi:SMC-Scp complex subunit ScpB [Woodsholea maritima]|uniref:SMC-Scp complex subunit ScpB n=1 Tax=Woodsholea maritima TaxID=240237 RepID=UPI0003669DD9|nr:SMC-Scp complex subunit ScpB [Woodsholea maritima]